MAKLKKRLTVLYHVAASEIGGSTYSFFEIIKNIDTQRYKPVVLITNNECSAFVNYLLESHIELIKLDLKINAWLLFNHEKRSVSSGLKSLGRILRHLTNSIKIAVAIIKHRIDIVHTNDENLIDAALGAFWARRTHIWHIRARIGKDGLLTHWMGTELVLYIIQILSKKIIVNSKSTLTPWSRTKYLYKATLVYNGIDIHRFKNGIGCLRKSCGLKMSSKIVLMITTAPQVDGLDHFISAARFVTAHLNETFFFVVGKTDKYIEDIRSNHRQNEFLKENKNIFFLGFRMDIPDILADADIVVEPMVNGSWSRVVLEAMSAGVPVIGVEENKTSDFIEDGITGVLVSGQDQIGQAILDLLIDSRKRESITKNAYRYVAENYSSRMYADNVMNVYDDALLK